MQAILETSHDFVGAWSRTDYQYKVEANRETHLLLLLFRLLYEQSRTQPAVGGPWRLLSERSTHALLRTRARRQHSAFRHAMYVFVRTPRETGDFSNRVTLPKTHVCMYKYKHLLPKFRVGVPAWHSVTDTVVLNE